MNDDSLNDRFIEEAFEEMATAKAALERTEATVASMNRIIEMVKKTTLMLKEESFGDDNAEILEDEWINMKKQLDAKAMNQNKEASQTKRKVVFEPRVTVVSIESSVDFSEKEIKRCWYSEAEMQKMRKVCYKVADRLDSGETKNRRLCSRGLEAMTRQGKKSCSVAYHACMNAVMDEQDIQWSIGYDDYDRLAVASQEASKFSVDQAIKRATKDEKDARKIYRLDQQKLSPPTLPKRKVSKVDLSLCLEQSWDTEEPQDPGVFAHRLGKENDMKVNLGKCCKNKDIRGPGRIVPMGYPLISIRANGV